MNLPIGNYSLLFRMESTDSFLRMFALDNIAISSCDYPPSQFHPRTSLLSFSCNFDNSTMCDMINREASSGELRFVSPFRTPCIFHYEHPVFSLRTPCLFSSVRSS